MTLEHIVMAPTAMSPPYLRREELKQTDIMLSVLCIMKVARPRVMTGTTTEDCSFRFPRLM